MSRPAAFQTSMTGHGGTVVEGSPDVFVNGKPAAGTGHAVLCPQHGPTAIATGRPDVLLNGRLMSRLLDQVICLMPPGPGEPLVDHGTPTFSAGGRDVYLDLKGTDVPQKELDALQRAIESGDPVAIQKAWDDLPLQATRGKGTAKIVDPADPNSYDEIELTGPSVEQKDGLVTPDLDVKPGGGQVQQGGSVGAVGVKRTKVTRTVGEDGAVYESRESVSWGVGMGGGFDVEWSDKRKGFSVGGIPGGFGGGAEQVKVGPAPMKKGIDVIVPPVSTDVLLGD